MSRTIATMDTGNVIVVEHGNGGKAREFCRRGVEVWEVLADGSKAPVCIGLAAGEPLVIRRGETLEGAIRRMLEPAKPRLVDRLPDLEKSLSVAALAAVEVLAWGSALGSLFGPFWIFG